MSDDYQLEIADTVLAWCDDCRLHAAKVIIWNAELNELEQIVEEAKGYLPACMTEQDASNEIRSLCSELSHKQLRAVRAYISLLLEGPCKTEECQEECNEDNS